MALRKEMGSKEGPREAICKKSLSDQCLFTRMAWRPIKGSGINESLGEFSETNQADDCGRAEKYQLEFNREFLDQARSSYSRGESRIAR